MPVPFTIYIYHRSGAYEPSTTHHFGNSSLDWQNAAQDIAAAMQPFHNQTVTLNRAELRTFDNYVVDGVLLGYAGTDTNDFDDFRDTTCITWASTGTLKPSMIYVPGRTDNLWSKGVPQNSLITAIGGLVAAYAQWDIKDSDGASITGYKRVKPSRRDRMRLAP